MPSNIEDNISKDESDWISIIYYLKRKHKQNVAMGSFNISSFRNRLDNIMGLIGNAIDVLIFAEAELDSSFVHFSFQMFKEGNPSAIADFQETLYLR